jgi:D-3-phosphoglycerate dehydrogenase
MNKRVVVTAIHFDEPCAAALHAAGYEVVLSKCSDSAAEARFGSAQLADILEGAEAWLVGHAYAREDLLSRLPDLKLIARCGVGCERIDLDAAKRLGKT